MRLLRSRIFILAVFLIPIRVGCAQHARVIPESGLLSTDMYVNEFFGFSFPLPQHIGYRIARVSSNIKGEHNLFGLVHPNGASVFSVSVRQMDIRDAERQLNVMPRISINGQDFGKGVQEPGHSGAEWKILYVTPVDGYLLMFEIHSRDKDIAEELQSCVERTKFFAPSNARAIAGANSKVYNPATLR
jgi:hypothetical protein